MLTITAQQYSQALSQKLHDRGQRQPLSGIWELTHRCNLNCVHCYCDRENNRPELTLNEIKSIINKVVQSGCLWLTFTGGEVFLRPDFPDIYAYARNQGLIITILSNGTLINESIAKQFAQSPPALIEITLYGRTQETYEKITGIKGSYERCLNGINLLRQHQIPFILKTVLLSLNKHELWEIKHWAKELGSPRFYFDPMIHSKCTGAKGPIGYRLPVEEAVQIELNDNERTEHLREYFQNHHGRTPDDFPYRYKCGAGRMMFAVNPYGQLNICLASRALNYDLRQGSFKDAFENRFPRIINQPTDKSNHACSDCKLFGFCHQCPAQSARECGAENIPVKYNCQRARLLAQRFTQDAKAETRRDDTIIEKLTAKDAKNAKVEMIND